MTANAQVLPPSVGGTPFEEDRGLGHSTSEEDLISPAPHALRTNSEIMRVRHSGPPRERTPNAFQGISQDHEIDPTGTSFTGGTAPGRDPGQMYSSARSVRSTTSKGSKSQRKSRLRQEVLPSPDERDPYDLFPYTRARLSDVPYKQPNPLPESNVTTDDLRRQMLSVVFGWEEDIRDLIRDELSRHPVGSRSTAYLSKWLNDDPDHLVSLLNMPEAGSELDWVVIALSGLSPKSNRKVVQTFAQKMLVTGDAHTAATVLLAIGDRNEAIEVYVSRNYYLEAILLTCLATPHDWQRQAHLVRRWGEHVVANSQQQLAIRCFACTEMEPSEQWTSPLSLFNSPTSNIGSALDAARSPLPNLASVAPPPAIVAPHKYRDAQTPIAMPPPPTPIRSALATGTRMTTKSSALKLITSFENSNQYNFPGLKSEGKTPTNGSVTPIAESAVARSALSPIVGPGFRGHGMRSISSLLSPRPGTAGGLHRSRLPSIGETPVDVHPPSFPIPKRKLASSESDSNKPDSSADEASKATPPTQSDSFVQDRDTEEHIQSAKTLHSIETVHPIQHMHTQRPQERSERPEALPPLLTSARYEPRNDGVRETPLTAVAPKTAINTEWPQTFDLTSLSQARQNLEERPRTGSRSRKPDNLSISMQPIQESMTTDETDEGDENDTGMPTANTTGSAAASYLDSLGDLTSPPTTGNSTRSAKSPSVSGRSLDKYISSLDEANYYNQMHRSRTPQSMRSNGREDYNDKNRALRPRRQEGRNEMEPKAIPRAKRSPSSPVPMSPADLRRFNVSVESFASAYQSQGSNTDGNRAKQKKGTSQRSASKGQSRNRHRSQSRHGSTADRNGESGTHDSRRRGRSKTRRSDSEGDSPASPKPLMPSEDDRQKLNDFDPALKLVAQQRELRHRSGSRRDGKYSRDASPDRRRPGKRSRSRRASDASANVPRRTSIGSRNERQLVNKQPTENANHVYQDPSRQDSMSSLPSTKYDPSAPTNGVQTHTERLRKELASAELEARRLSLARRPSAPSIPVPGQPAHNKTISTGDVNVSSDQEPSRYRSDSGESQNTPYNTSRGTPRAMPYPAARGQDPTIPDIPDHLETLLSSNVYRPAEEIGRSTSAPTGNLGLPEVPTQDLPRHPAFDHRVAASRSSSRARDVSRDRGTSRERGPHGEVAYTMGGQESTIHQTTVTVPPLLPELQHLASPPPPPPVPLQLLPGQLKAQFGPDIVNAANSNAPFGKLSLRTDLDSVPVPPLPSRSAGAYPEQPHSASPSTHRRGRSGNDNNLMGKMRNIADRMRSSSRGRVTGGPSGDNYSSSTGTATTKSPNQGSDYTTISPFAETNSSVTTANTAIKDNERRHANERFANIGQQEVFSPYESIIPPDARVMPHVSPSVLQGRWNEH